MVFDGFLAEIWWCLSAMMAGGGTQQSLRKYLGAIKDSTTVGLAKVNSDYKVGSFCSFSLVFFPSVWIFFLLVFVVELMMMCF